MENNSIIINNVSVRFGTHTALNGIYLNIPFNSFVTVVGPNGGGKSTLLKVILGLIKPSEGTINIFGKNHEMISSDSIGYVPQIKTLDRTFPALPIELAATGLRRKWAGRIGLKEKKELLEILNIVGAGHLANRPIEKLSGGELQRIYLARSFVRKPKLLLLDEPASGIDAVGESDLNKMIDEYKNRNNSIIIMVTHDWEAAYHHADYVILLNKKLICFDKPDSAFSENNLRETFGHIGHKHEMIFSRKHSHE
jgi:zinc transport system ATP-binding protein